MENYIVAMLVASRTSVDPLSKLLEVDSIIAGGGRDSRRGPAYDSASLPPNKCRSPDTGLTVVKRNGLKRGCVVYTG